MAEGMNGFASPRAEAFPAGLRVLVVDDDPTWLKILEKMLKKCSYEVTTCGLAIEALDLLRERKVGFDIVISDVNMPDMDGFKLLEHVGLEMELPVIMMSVDGETSRVMRGVQHGACDYLLKPIRMKELRNIWQHVYRKKIHEVRDVESYEGLEEILMMRNVSEQSDDGYFLCGGDMTTGKKRKDAEHKYDENEFTDHSLVKKARVVWTVDLHQKFVKAVNQIGFDKVGPKKILDLMNVPWLTRENVASHLQKYRLYLTRLHKDNDLKPSSTLLKHPDFSPRDAAGDRPNPANVQQNSSVNGSRTPSNLLVHNANSRIHEVDLKTIASSQTTEPKNVLTGYAATTHKASSSSNGISQSFGSTQYSAFNSAYPTRYSWNAEVSKIQFKQDQPQFQFENGFNNLGLSLQCHNQVNLPPLHSATHGSFCKERDEPSNSNSESRSSFGSYSMLSQNLMPSFRPPDPVTSSTWSLEDDQGLEQTSIHNLDLPACLPQSQYSSSTNLDMQNKCVPECNDPHPELEVPSILYDALRFDYEYPPDSLEYPVIDQGLFII